jgi:hypothetical protein
MMFEKLAWFPDRMLLDNLVFRLEHYKREDWDLGENCFSFYKIKPLVDQYARFWATRRDFHPQRIFELGLWDGGSLVFWFEYFHPYKYVGIDISQSGDSAYFRQYVASKKLEAQVKTYWGIDQADILHLREIVTKEFNAQLDLVIDDASHLYGPTKTSFETLFPLLRPGGLYIIEDWAWAHWKESQGLTNSRSYQIPLTRLISEFTEATGTSTGLISSLSVYQGFIAVERGEEQLHDISDFHLQRHIVRLPRYTFLLRPLGMLHRLARRLLARR